MRMPSGPDVLEYDNWARAIISGVFGWTQPHIHAPGYPFFLAALLKITGMDYFWVRMLQSMIGFLALGLLFPVLNKLCEKPEVRAIPWLYLSFAAVFPPLIYYQCELVSEALLLPLLCLSIFCLYRCDDYWATHNRIDWRLCCGYATAGMLSGMAVITHPLALLFSLGELMFLTHRLFRWKNGGCGRARASMTVMLFALMLAAVILPVCIRNAALPGGGFMIQKNGGMNYFIGNNPEATGGCYVRPGAPWEKLRLEGERAAVMRSISPDRYYFGLAVEYICAHPLAWLELQTCKLLYVFNWRDMISGSDPGPIRYFTPFQRYNAWCSGVIFGLALFGLLFNLRRGEFIYRYRHFLILLFSFWLVLTFSVVSGRYRVALLPSVFLFAAYGGCNVFQVLKWKYRGKTLGWLAVCALLAGGVVFFPAPYDVKGEKIEADLLLGEVLLQQKNLTAAEQYFVGADETAAGKSARAICLLGTVHMQRGSYRQARDYFVRALTIDPELCEAIVNLGVISMNVGNYSVAEACFREALDKAPQNPLVLCSYGSFLVKRKDYQEAEKVLKRCLELEPANLSALNALGVLYMLRDEPGQAVTCFDRLLALRPEDLRILSNMVAACIKDHQMDRAEYFLGRLMRSAPDSAEGKSLRQVIDAIKRQAR